MNVAAGFDTRLAFHYAAGEAGFVNVYDDVNGAGKLLASVNLGVNVDSCLDLNNLFCNFEHVEMLFAGSGRSVAFGVTAGWLAFDDITLGALDAEPAPVPEPPRWCCVHWAWPAWPHPVASYAARSGTRRSKRVLLFACCRSRRPTPRETPAVAPAVSRQGCGRPTSAATKIVLLSGMGHGAKWRDGRPAPQLLTWSRQTAVPQPAAAGVRSYCTTPPGASVNTKSHCAKISALTPSWMES